MSEYQIIRFGDKMEISKLKDSIEDIDLNTVIIFIKKGARTIVSEDNLHNIYKKICKLLERYDVFYLANVMESCKNDTDAIDEFYGFKIHQCRSPNGFYAIAGKKASWTKIIRYLKKFSNKSVSNSLNKLVISKEITAITSWPRIYITESSYDFYPCRNDTVMYSQKTPEQELSLYYFILSVLILSIFLTTFHKYN